MGFPYSWVNTRCANDGRIYTIPIPMSRSDISWETRIFSLTRGLCYALHVQRNTLLASI